MTDEEIEKIRSVVQQINKILADNKLDIYSENIYKDGSPCITYFVEKSDFNNERQIEYIYMQGEKIHV